MGTDIESVCRLVAYEEMRSVPIASVMKVSVHPDALLFCPLAMAGEGDTIHAIAYGRLDGDPVFRFTADPRSQREHIDLLGVVGIDLEEWFQAMTAADSYPQLWVASSAGIELVECLADRFRFHPDPLARRFGECLSHFPDRHAVAGQQGIHCITTALKAHFVTGMSPPEEEHLGSLLAWFSRPGGGSVFDAAEAASKVPMGIRTDPRYDRGVLEPMVSRYSRCRNRNGSRSELEKIAAMIGDALRPVACRIFEAAREGLRVLGSSGLPPMTSLPEMEKREIEAFQFFMTRLAAGYRLPREDRPATAALKLATREEAARGYEAALSMEDGFSRTQSRLDGAHLVGCVSRTWISKAPKRGTAHFITVNSSQRLLRIRKGDVLYSFDDPRLRFAVDGAVRTGGGVSVTLRVAGGMRTLAIPVCGDEVELVPEVPDRERLCRIRRKVSMRLKRASWTHGKGHPMPTTGSSHPAFVPMDPLAVVEAIR